MGTKLADISMFGGGGRATNTFNLVRKLKTNLSKVEPIAWFVNRLPHGFVWWVVNMELTIFPLCCLTE